MIHEFETIANLLESKFSANSLLRELKTGGRLHSILEESDAFVYCDKVLPEASSGSSSLDFDGDQEKSPSCEDVWRAIFREDQFDLSANEIRKKENFQERQLILLNSKEKSSSSLQRHFDKTKWKSRIKSIERVFVKDKECVRFGFYSRRDLNSFIEFSEKDYYTTKLLGKALEFNFVYAKENLTELVFVILRDLPRNYSVSNLRHDYLEFKFHHLSECVDVKGSLCALISFTMKSLAEDFVIAWAGKEYFGRQIKVNLENRSYKAFPASKDKRGLIRFYTENQECEEEEEGQISNKIMGAESLSRPRKQRSWFKRINPSLSLLRSANNVPNSKSQLNEWIGDSNKRVKTVNKPLPPSFPPPLLNERERENVNLYSNSNDTPSLV